MSNPEDGPHKKTKKWQDHWPKPKEEVPYVGSGLYNSKSKWFKAFEGMEEYIDESAIEHMANLMREAIDEDIIAAVIAQAKQRFRVMRMGDVTQLMEWDGESWVLKCTMLGDFDFILEPDWSDEAR